MTPIKIQTLGNTTLTINADQICVIRNINSTSLSQITTIRMSNGEVIETQTTIQNILNDIKSSERDKELFRLNKKL